MSQKDPNNIWKGAILTSAIGADIVIWLTIGYFLGKWIKGFFNDSFIWEIAGLLFGIVMSVISVIGLIKVYGDIK